MVSRSAAIAGWLTVVAGLALMAVHYFAGSPGDPEGWFSAMGFGAPVVGAGGMAVVGHRFDKPGLCLAGGFALGVISLVSIVMIPLLIAAGFMAVSGAKAVLGLSDLITPMIFGAGLIAVFAVLVFHQDPASWSTADGSGASSNIVTSAEASLSLLVVAGCVLGSIVWSTRRTHERT